MHSQKASCLLALLLFAGCCRTLYAQSVEGQADSLKAARFLQEANQAYDADDYDTAYRLLDSALSIFSTRQQGLNIGSADCYFLRGQMERRQKRLPPAVEAYAQALSIRKQVLGPRDASLAIIHHNLAFCKYALGKTSEAIQDFEQAASVLEYHSAYTDTLLSMCYYNLGVIAYNQGEIVKANGFSLKGVESNLLSFSKPNKTLGSLYSNLGYGYFMLGDFLSSKVYTGKSIDVFTGLYGTQHPETAIGLSNMATTLQMLGEYSAAQELALRALRIRESLQPVPSDDLGESYTMLCGLYYELGEYEIAEEYGLMGLQQFSKNIARNISNLPKAHINLGNTYLLQERYDDALAQYDKASGYLAFSGKTGLPFLVDLCSNKSVLYERMGNYAESLKQIQQAIHLHGQRPDENLSKKIMLQANLGISFLKLTEYDSARSTLSGVVQMEESQDMSRRVSYIAALNGLGQCLHKQGRYTEALTFCEQSLAANQYQPGRLSYALHLYQLLTSLTEMAAIWSDRRDGSRQQNLEKSLALYAEACDGADLLWRSNSPDQMSRQTYRTAAYPIYEGYIRTALELEKDLRDGRYARLAWQMSERARGHTLRESFQRTRAREVSGVPPAVMAEAGQLSGALAFWERQRLLAMSAGQDSLQAVAADSLLFLRRKEEQFWQEVKTSHADYYNLCRESFVEPMGQIQSSLPPNTCQLSYFAGDSSLFAFVLRPDTLLTRKIALDFPLKHWVDTLRRSLTDYFYHSAESEVLLQETADAYAEAAFFLYQKLVAPLAGELTPSVTIIPDGALGYIPFDALLMEKPAVTTRFSTHAYWGLEKRLYYAYSATLQHAMQHRDTATAPALDLLAMAPFFRGNPDTLREREFPQGVALKTGTARRGLWPLPASGQEVRDLARHWRGHTLYGLQGTREAFLEAAPQARIIHLSTHGQAGDAVGDQAWIAFSLAGDSTRFDKLFLREVYAMRLRADLVTLSACETGLGPLQRGEGIVSMARAFAFAGAGSICMSMWQVSDEHSAALMRLFYENLHQGMTKDAALQEARRAYVRGKKGVEAHPYYWSGFVLVGDVTKL